MTPQEKANELVLKYLRIENTNEWWSKVPAKQCALIVVDEVWRQLEAARVFEDYDYWQEVKKEIERL